MFTLLLTFALSYDTYNRFSTVIMQDYESNALETKQTSLTFLDADNFSAYNKKSAKLQELLDQWQKIIDTQDAMFIYVIEPFNNYENIRFNMNVTRADSIYNVVPIGEERKTSNDEYKKIYRSLYDGEKNYGLVIRDNGVSNVGDHITALVPVRNSAGVVESILCVQLQMDKLDAEKILFLKRTTQAVLKEISGGNLNKKLDIKTGDELQILTENFNTIIDKLKM